MDVLEEAFYAESYRASGPGRRGGEQYRTQPPQSGQEQFQEGLKEGKAFCSPGRRPSQSFKYPGQPRIAPIVLFCSWGTQGGTSIAVEDPEGLMLADSGGGAGRSSGTSLYGAVAFLWKAFPVWLRQEGLLCGKGGAAAQVLREQRAAEGGPWWVGDSQGQLHGRLKVPLCAPEVCVHWPTGSSCRWA